MPRAYYYSAEYKRIQRQRKAEREGRTLIQGRGNALAAFNRATGFAHSGARISTAADVSDTVWRRLEITNARQAWSYWISQAPAWWLTSAARARQQHERIGQRVLRAKRRARKKTQQDGTVSDKYLAVLIKTTRNCMWCSVSLTLPMHKRYEPTMATIEHILPLCQGGLHSKENIGVACARCNYSRAKRAA